MNPPKFNIGQTVYTIWTDDKPDYRSFVVETRELDANNRWVYKGYDPQSNNNRVREHFESELTGQVPTIEDCVKGQIHLHFNADYDQRWSLATLDRNVFEWLVIKAGYWRDEYKPSLE